MSKKSKKALLKQVKAGEAMPKNPPMRVSQGKLALLKSSMPAKDSKITVRVNSLPKLPKGVMPTGMAQDYAPAMNALATAQQYNISLGFPGYGILAELAQLTEYRNPVETLANEMTRKWLEIKSTGDEDRTQAIKDLTTAIGEFDVEAVCRVAVEHDGLYGRGQIYIDLGQPDDDLNPLMVDKESIGKGELKGFKNIEPYWTSPANYNTDDPRDKWFYRPTGWYVMGMQIHDSRLMTIVSRPVPDMLKPAYNFGGISQTQLLMPYVNNWLRTRNSVSDLVNSFSISGLKTDLSVMLNTDSSMDVINRAELFNMTRDNMGLMLLNNEKEEFFQFNTPLGGIDKLQAQAQEQMASPTHIPLVKLFGITPSGLNASTEGEITVYHEYIATMQNALLDKPMQQILKILQLHLFGEIYDDIVHEWNSLEELTEEQIANVNKTKAETGAGLIEAGVISQEEERQRIASEHSSGYNGLDVDELPEAPQEDDEERQKQSFSFGSDEAPKL